MSTRSGTKRGADIGQIEEKEVKVSKPNDSDLSDYERVRLENIKRNQEFLGNLGLDLVKPDLPAHSSSSDKVSKRGVTVVKKKVFDVPVRRSSRVTSERLKEEIDQLKAQLAEGTKSDSMAIQKQIDEKQVQYDLMMSQKQAQSYEVLMEAVNSDPRFRLPRDPIPLLAASNLPEDNEGDIWVEPLITLLKSQAKVSASAKQRPATTKKPKSEDESYIQSMKALSLAEDDVAKLTESRVAAVWFHPTPHKLICAAGDKAGNIGLWDVDSKSTGVGGVFKYKPHVEGVNKIFCWENEPSKMYSCSYDGTIRVLDLNTNSFSLAFEAPEDYGDDIAFADVAFRESVNNVILIGRSDGTVALADLRANMNVNKNKYEWVHRVHPARVNSILYHPTIEYLVISSGAKMEGEIHVNDIRKLPSSGTWKPLLTIRHHSKSINATACSPDGNFLATVSYDNTIRAYSNFTLNEASVQSTKVYHGKCFPLNKYIIQALIFILFTIIFCIIDNNTGRWLSTFRPIFDPKHPHAFIVGSMVQPRQIDVFIPSMASGSNTVSLSSVLALKGEFLGSVCSRNACHPSQNVVAGGNSSGRVHIFR